MVSEFDWPQIFLHCKQNILAHVCPLLKTQKDLQPDLGVGAGGDKTKLVDLAAEKAIVEVFLQHDVSFTLVSEESGIKEYGTTPKGCYVTVDPVDGTTNLTRGLPFYCSSIAVSRKSLLSDVFAATVIDLFHGNTYMAIRGKGAYRDETKIATSTETSLSEAAIGLDLNSYKVKELVPQLSELIQSTKHIRHFGANALELCFVAEGLTDAFIDIRGKLRTTDVAASFLILKEAGGTISTPNGKSVDAKLDPTQTLIFVASGNKKIHQKILNLIRQK
jgi:myo-inositol-1(or 4)-monophosphatase